MSDPKHQGKGLRLNRWSGVAFLLLAATIMLWPTPPGRADIYIVLAVKLGLVLAALFSGAVISLIARASTRGSASAGNAAFIAVMIASLASFVGIRFFLPQRSGPQAAARAQRSANPATLVKNFEGDGRKTLSPTDEAGAEIMRRLLEARQGADRAYAAYNEAGGWSPENVVDPAQLTERIALAESMIGQIDALEERAIATPDELAALMREKSVPEAEIQQTIADFEGTFRLPDQLRLREIEREGMRAQIRRFEILREHFGHWTWNAELSDASLDDSVPEEFDDEYAALTARMLEIWEEQEAINTVLQGGASSK